MGFGPPLRIGEEDFGSFDGGEMGEFGGLGAVRAANLRLG